MRSLLLALVAAVAVAAVPAAAQAKLPAPKNKTIRPNVGIGKLKLLQPLRPLPKGWRKPTRCRTLENLTACGWTKRRDAYPPAGQTGIKGPFLYAAGTRRDLIQLAISAGDREPQPGALRRWKTPAGIGIGSALERFRAVYPQAVPGGLADMWVIRGTNRRTNFTFVGGRLHRIEINACTELNPVCE